MKTNTTETITNSERKRREVKKHNADYEEGRKEKVKKPVKNKSISKKMALFLTLGGAGYKS